ncbi:hypothetical protein CLOM_g2043 [Closterium sp. NIES-68]|nr:hypothetical protein CLOM_g2043 [Closterium sp. NIES-68]
MRIQELGSVFSTAIAASSHHQWLQVQVFKIRTGVLGARDLHRGDSNRLEKTQGYSGVETANKCAADAILSGFGELLLRIVDPERPFEVITDASDIAIGAVLMQDFGNGLQPIVYESRKMQSAERNYPVHDKEMLAIVHTFKIWRGYLTGADVTVQTDHKSLHIAAVLLLVRYGDGRAALRGRMSDLPANEIITSATDRCAAAPRATSTPMATPGIISDRDPRFTLKFWQDTWAWYGTRLQFSSPYLPQTDGQTERTNQTMEQLVRTNCPDRNKWDDALPMLEFSYNNAPSATTNHSPFYLNYGMYPTVPISTNVESQNEVTDINKLCASIPDDLAKIIQEYPEIFPDDWTATRTTPGPQNRAGARHATYYTQAMAPDSTRATGITEPAGLPADERVHSAKHVTARSTDPVHSDFAYRVSYSLRELRIHGDAVWINERPLDVPTHHERGVPRSTRQMRDNLPGRHSDLQQDPGATLRGFGRGFSAVAAASSHHQGLQVRVFKTRTGVPGAHDLHGGDSDRPEKTPGYSGMETINKPAAAAIFSGFCELRFAVYTQHGGVKWTSNRSSTEGDFLRVGGEAASCVRGIKESFNVTTSVYYLRSGTDRIWVPSYRLLRELLIQEVHNSNSSGHFGVDISLKALQRFYYWPDMVTDVRRYVAACPICQRMKSSHQRPTGLLQPLEPPQRPWQHVTMDFVTGLPAGPSGNDAVLVVVDRLMKMAHFAPCRTTITAEETARLFISTVIRLHGIPAAIISDRDPKFTSKFWQDTWARYGTRLQFSSAYHPQTDGQTERTNQTMEQLIRTNCPYRKKWEDVLPMLEFSYNNRYSYRVRSNTPEASGLFQTFLTELPRLLQTC